MFVLQQTHSAAWDTSNHYVRDHMDFTSLYSARIQKTFDEDQAEILKTFLRNLTAKDGAKVILTNYYRGLPVTYPATVLGVEHGSLDLEVNKQQAVAIDSDHYTLIRSALFPFPIFAHAQYVNIKKHAVSLSKLCFVEVLAEKRAAVRLNLEPPVHATIHVGDQGIAGELMDISTQGLAVSVDDCVTLERGAEMSIRFMLPDSVLMKQTLLKVSANLVDIVGEASPYRYKFRILPEKHQEQTISRYSFQRQVEIIRAIKELAD